MGDHYFQFSVTLKPAFSVPPDRKWSGPLLVSPCGSSESRGRAKGEQTDRGSVWPEGWEGRMGLRVGSGISEGRECKGEAGWSPAVMAEGVEEGGDLRFTPLGEVRGVLVAGPYPEQEQGQALGFAFPEAAGHERDRARFFGKVEACFKADLWLCGSG